LSIYAHALEAGEVAAAKIWDDAMDDVISTGRKAEPKRMLANVSARPTQNPQDVEMKELDLGWVTGLEPVTSGITIRRSTD
jgi:hypothetical protein